MKEFYTLAELSNMFYLALTSSKNAQTTAEKYGEEDDFILNFVEYTKTKYNEVMKLIQTLGAFDEVSDYIGGLRKDGNKRYYTKINEEDEKTVTVRAKDGSFESTYEIKEEGDKIMNEEPKIKFVFAKHEWRDYDLKTINTTLEKILYCNVMATEKLTISEKRRLLGEEIIKKYGKGE